MVYSFAAPHLVALAPDVVQHELHGLESRLITLKQLDLLDDDIDN